MTVCADADVKTPKLAPASMVVVKRRAIRRLLVDTIEALRGANHKKILELELYEAIREVQTEPQAFRL
ncbi:MAG: hypothetical protein DHS20C04_18660 [Hyphococcus sp.]|nr:MAG: hypothetical protein DHS20C04_18660 [Marinicaulis sp.]